MAESGEGNWPYADYLNLHPLLGLQGEDRGINSDEMHFIIVHQTFELWFKQVIRELSEVRDILSQVPVPEDQIPKAVDHLGRTTEIFRLMANQWTVLETLTPQGFLAFRDGLGTASGFESSQMREFEFLLGLQNEDRIGGVDPLDSFRRMPDNELNKAVLARLEAAANSPSLYYSVMSWIERTPIMGSTYGSKNDPDVVSQYISDHLSAHKTLCEEAVERSAGWGAGDSGKAAERMVSAHDGAVSLCQKERSTGPSRASCSSSHIVSCRYLLGRAS